MSNTTPPTVLILGKGEIARCLAHLGTLTGFSITVSEPGVEKMDWPPGIAIRESIYPDSPWSLEPDTHVIIVRGHEGDTRTVTTLLNHSVQRAGIKQVYLIASARRTFDVIDEVTPFLIDRTSLKHLSAPAGLDLGGNSSMEIAISILGEILLRHYGRTGRVLTDLRRQRASPQKPLVSQSNARESGTKIQSKREMQV